MEFSFFVVFSQYSELKFFFFVGCVVEFLSLFFLISVALNIEAL